MDTFKLSEKYIYCFISYHLYFLKKTKYFEQLDNNKYAFLIDENCFKVCLKANNQDFAEYFNNCEIKFMTAKTLQKRLNNN